MGRGGYFVNNAFEVLQWENRRDDTNSAYNVFKHCNERERGYLVNNAFEILQWEKGRDNTTAHIRC